MKYSILASVVATLMSSTSVGATIPTITNTEIGQIVEVETRGCHCQGSGGRDCDSTGTYVAPYGFSIVSVNPITRASTRGNFRITNQTQPGYIYLKDVSSADVSVLLTRMAEQTKDSDTAIRLFAIAATVNTLRLIHSSTHAQIDMVCHAESHRVTWGGHDNGNIGVDLAVTLVRQPAVDDFNKVMLELIKYTQEPSDSKLDAIVDLLDKLVNGPAAAG